MFKVTIEGPGLNFTATDLGYGAAHNIVKMAMEAKSPRKTRSEKVVMVPEVEPESLPEPESVPAGDGEPP